MYPSVLTNGNRLLHNRGMKQDKTRNDVRRTILFVEDEEELRREMRRFLEGLGYQILMAEQEKDALEVVQGWSSPIDLILINQRMISDEALTVGRRIRDLGEISEQVPVVVIPYEFSNGKEGTDQCVGGNDHKSYMTSTAQLGNLLQRFAPTS